MHDRRPISPLNSQSLPSEHHAKLNMLIQELIVAFPGRRVEEGYATEHLLRDLLDGLAPVLPVLDLRCNYERNRQKSPGAWVQANLQKRLVEVANAPVAGNLKVSGLAPVRLHNKIVQKELAFGARLDPFDQQHLIPPGLAKDRVFEDRQWTTLADLFKDELPMTDLHDLAKLDANALSLVDG